MRDHPYAGFVQTGYSPKRRTPPRDRRGRFVARSPYRRAIALERRARPRRHEPNPLTLCLLLVAFVLIATWQVTRWAGVLIARLVAHLVEQHRARVQARATAALQVEQRRHDELEAIGAGARGWATWSAENGMPAAAVVWATIADEHEHQAADAA